MWWQKIFGIWLRRWVCKKRDSALWGGKLASPVARFALIASNFKRKMFEIASGLKRKCFNYASEMRLKRARLNFA